MVPTDTRTADGEPTLLVCLNNKSHTVYGETYVQKKNPEHNRLVHVNVLLFQKKVKHAVFSVFFFEVYECGVPIH